jgi:hypothetical protein
MATLKSTIALESLMLSTHTLMMNAITALETTERMLQAAETYGGESEMIDIASTTINNTLAVYGIGTAAKGLSVKGIGGKILAALAVAAGAKVLIPVAIVSAAGAAIWNAANSGNASNETIEQNNEAQKFLSISGEIQKVYEENNALIRSGVSEWDMNAIAMRNYTSWLNDLYKTYDGCVDKRKEINNLISMMDDLKPGMANLISDENDELYIQIELLNKLSDTFIETARTRARMQAYESLMYEAFKTQGLTELALKQHDILKTESISEVYRLERLEAEQIQEIEDMRKYTYYSSFHSISAEFGYYNYNKDRLEEMEDVLYSTQRDLENARRYERHIFDEINNLLYTYENYENDAEYFFKKMYENKINLSTISADDIPLITSPQNQTNNFNIAPQIEIHVAQINDPVDADILGKIIVRQICDGICEVAQSDLSRTH